MRNRSTLTFFLLLFFVFNLSFFDSKIVHAQTNSFEDCGKPKYITLPNPFILNSKAALDLDECRSQLSEAISAYVSPICVEVRSQKCGITCSAYCGLSSPPPQLNTPIPGTPTPHPGETDIRCDDYSVPPTAISYLSGMIALNPCRVTIEGSARIRVICVAFCPQSTPSYEDGF